MLFLKIVWSRRQAVQCHCSWLCRGRAAVSAGDRVPRHCVADDLQGLAGRPVNEAPARQACARLGSRAGLAQAGVVLPRPACTKALLGRLSVTARLRGRTVEIAADQTHSDCTSGGCPVLASRALLS